MSEWRPIDTAPKDGTTIIVSCPYFGQTGAVWFEGIMQTPIHSEHVPYHKTSNRSAFSIAPTHWMPLPEPPK